MSVEYYSRKTEKKEKQDIQYCPKLIERRDHKNESIFMVKKDIELSTSLAYKDTDICKIKKGTCIYIEKISRADTRTDEEEKYKITFHYLENNRVYYENGYVTQKELEGINKKLISNELTNTLQEKYSRLHYKYLREENELYERFEKRTYLWALGIIIISFTSGILVGFSSIKDSVLLGFLIVFSSVFILSMIGNEILHHSKIKYMLKHNMMEEADLSKCDNAEFFQMPEKLRRINRRALKEVLKDGETLQPFIDEVKDKKDIQVSLSKNNKISVCIDKMSTNDLSKQPTQVTQPVNKQEEKTELLVGDWQTFPNSPLQLFVSKKTITN